ncbi:MAG: sigma-70 family RNA polymerase sigma factor [Phototrophicaceae bacterium]
MENRDSARATVYEGFDPDWALVRSMAEGDVRALNEVYALYGPMLLGFLNARLPSRQLAEEVLQDVMLAVWDNAKNFEARSKVKTWLLVIARNRAINATRRKKLPLIDISQVFDLKSDDTSPMEAVVRHETQDKVRTAIHKLPEGQREVLVLVFYHQLTGPEVAEVLDISEGTVKSRLHRAKENLKGLLAQDGNL